MTNLAQIIFSHRKESTKTAYFFGSDKISYQDLYKNISSLSEFFTQSGCARGERVLINLYDSPAIAEIFFASIAIGLIPIIINPRLSIESLAYIVTDSKCQFIFCENDNVDSTKELITKVNLASACTIILQDKYKTCTQEHPVVPVQSYKTLLENTADLKFYSGVNTNGAFWQYTSGTTGNPKAVMHSHETMIINTECYARKTMGFGENDIFYSAAKMFFGYGAGASLFFPLLLGASAVLDPQMPSTDVNILININKYNPSVFFGAPHIYASLIQHESRLQNLLKNNFKCISAGSTLPASVLNNWRKSFNINIYDGIGATELGHIFISNSKDNIREGCTGKPVSGYTVALGSIQAGKIEFSKENKGTLCVRPPHSNLGYWGASEKTAEKFIDGWYITGDIFEVDNGYYRYIGREDDLFKSDGIWVEPLAIETALVSCCPHIRECALVAKINDEGLTEPALYLCINKTDKGNDEILSEIRKIAKTVCEKHSYPKQVFIIDSMPRNDNGKIMRHRLKEQLTA